MAGLTERIALIGGGKMGEALIRALCDNDLAAPEQIAASDPIEARRAALTPLGVRVAAANGEVVADADLVIVAVSPAVVPAVLEEIAPARKAGGLICSIAAGVTLEQIESRLPAGTPVIRVMPNTPVQVGAGAAGVARGRHATAAHAELVLRIFGAAGSRCRSG
jgi:pyrroline-5-carboxylate reductase